MKYVSTGHGNRKSNISELLGKTFYKVELLHYDGDCDYDYEDVIVFYSEDGKYMMGHVYDCCESVLVEDVVGDLDDLVGAPILLAEEATNNDNPKSEYTDSCTWTFYKLATSKGYVDIRWYGQSNGYYSESVQLVFYPKGDK